MLHFGNKIMILITIIVAVLQLNAWYPQLPNPMPSHFDDLGQVNGTMDKTLFCGMMGGLLAMFVIGFPLLGKLLKLMPNSLINMPNREYWLAGERRDRSLQIVSDLLSFIGWSSGWFFIGLFQLTALVAVNVRAAITPEFYWMMVIYLMCVLGSVAWLTYRFRLPPADKANVP